jgi:uncharacterized membrane protein
MIYIGPVGALIGTLIGIVTIIQAVAWLCERQGWIHNGEDYWRCP